MKNKTLKFSENFTQQDFNALRNEVMLESIGDSLVTTDADGYVTQVNKAFEELLGWSRKDVEGKKLVDIIPMKDASGKLIKESERIISRVIIEKTKLSSSPTETVYYERKDGTLLPVSVTASPILIGGTVIGAVETFRDITKEKEIDKAKTEFVSLASHQLRTPLSTIGWYAEMLLEGDGGKVTKEQTKYIEEIYRGNRRMADLVGALLNVSRIDLGTFAVEPEPTNLVELAQATVKDLEPRIFARKIDFEEEYDKKLPIMNVDPKLMRMVVENLASNAVKYTQEKGKVKLSIKKLPEAVRISVEDNGFGIPKKQHDKIFSKLFRADNVKAKDTEGTGLGLYIVKSIVDYSGGKIWFESEEDKGTTFIVELPMKGMKQKTGSKALD